MAEDRAGQRLLDIRKYPNRRYYDTTRSRHVTLEDIYGLIRDGYEVRILDSRTEQDITAKVLAQIILDLDSPKLGVFPVPLLHRLIRSNEQLVNDFVEKYFNQALSAFLDSQRSFEQFMRRAMGLEAAAGAAPQWAQMMWGALAPWTAAAASSSSPKATAPGRDASPPAVEPAASALGPGGAGDELRQRVEDLQRQVAQLRQPPRARREQRAAGRRRAAITPKRRKSSSAPPSGGGANGAKPSA